MNPWSELKALRGRLAQAEAELEAYRALRMVFEKQHRSYLERERDYRKREEHMTARYFDGAMYASAVVLDYLKMIREQYSEEPPEPPAEDSRLEDLRRIEEAKNILEENSILTENTEGDQKLRDAAYRVAVETLLDVVGRLLK
ncbi:MAG: hypothetical protein H6830_04495 [Planctomycetes bacterium]|nr:hypothetical protein [Planctomycetota bacterium]MCB9910495.1 hypothetical protein [Planctomycetota bacterium]MCB9912621.1 hypothetical protein [Planctomycetota bacterium]HRV80251.1 hypothetical protein [Planctomycetota bacterium]